MYTALARWTKAYDMKNKLDLERISPVAVELQHPQGVGPYLLANGQCLIGKWPWSFTSADQDDSNKLDLEWINLVVTEL